MSWQSRLLRRPTPLSGNELRNEFVFTTRSPLSQDRSAVALGVNSFALTNVIGRLEACSLCLFRN